MALWYKNSGPWWDSTHLVANDCISLEEERADPGSLFNFYRQLIRLRKTHAALSSGRYQSLPNNNDQVLSFTRYTRGERIMVIINLSPSFQTADVTTGEKQVNPKKWKSLLGKAAVPVIKNHTLAIHLAPYGIQGWKVL
jgi:glycosidase